MSDPTGPPRPDRPEPTEGPAALGAWTRRGVLTALLGVPVAAAVLPLEGSGISPLPDDPPRTTVAPTTTIAPTTTSEAPTTTVAPAPPRRVTIAEENRPSRDRRLGGPAGRAVWDKVRGYASRTSVAPGESFYLFVSTGRGPLLGHRIPDGLLRRRRRPAGVGVRARSRAGSRRPATHRPRHQHARRPLEAVAARCTADDDLGARARTCSSW